MRKSGIVREKVEKLKEQINLNGSQIQIHHDHHHQNHHHHHHHHLHSNSHIIKATVHTQPVMN